MRGVTSASRPLGSGLRATDRDPSAGLPTPFAEAVLDLVEQIPPGRVMAYGDVAGALGTGGARAVGTVMMSSPRRYSTGGQSWILSAMMMTDGRLQLFGFKPSVPTPRVTTSRM